MAKRPPGTKTVTIEDCKSLKLVDNPAPFCPHGKEWRESDYKVLPREEQNRRCAHQACAATEYTPHAGERIVLVAPRTIKGRQPFVEYAVAMGTRGIAGAQAELQAIVAKAVVDWSWTGVTEGEVLPLPSQDWDRIASELEGSELIWILNALLAGGDPYQEAAAEGNAPAA